MRKSLLFFITILLGFNSFGQSNASLVSEVSLDSLVKSVREFTGEDSTWVNDSFVRIQHRISTKNNDLAADYLVDRLEDLGYKVDQHNYRSGGRNITATLEGKTNPDSIYIFGAHYDAVADYCADDNASGSAAVLEAARIMSKYCFENTVIYAFWDEEERGLIGSRYHADTAFARGDRILGMLNTDMMGYDSDSNRVFDIHTSPDSINLAMKDTILYVLDTLNIDLVPQVINPGTTRSDHASFWKRGYAAVYMGESFLGGDPNPSYHTSSDRINLFNLGYYHKLAQLSFGVIVELAGLIPTSIEIDTVYACEYFTYKDSTFTESVVYHDSLVTAIGCDSVYVIDLRIKRSVEIVDTISSCTNYTYRDSTYTLSGIYHDTLVAVNGCDSVYTMDLTILNVSYSGDTIAECDSYAYRDTIFTASGIYLDTLIGQNGCDSVYTLDLTILRSTSSSDTVIECVSYTYRDTVFTLSTLYRDTLDNQLGCDSVFTLDLTILNISNFADTVKACNSYTYNGQVIRSSGIYRDKLVAQNGCDSFYILDLRLTHLSDSVYSVGRSIIAHDSTATFAWLDCNNALMPLVGDTARTYTVTSDGNYAVEVRKGECVDTSDCVERIISSVLVPLDESFTVKVFPNPSDGMVNIELNDQSGKVDVSVLSITGQLISQDIFDNEKFMKIELPNDDGVYFIVVRTESGSKVVRVLKAEGAN